MNAGQLKIYKILKCCFFVISQDVVSPYHAHEVVVQSAGGDQPVDDEVAKLEKALGINLKSGGGGGGSGGEDLPSAATVTKALLAK